MDALAALLDGPRARHPFLLRCELEAPWSVRIEDEAPLTVMAVIRGTAWLRPDDADPEPMGPGDVAILRGPDPYTVADRPDTEPQVVIGPGQVCSAVPGVAAPAASFLGVRTWGNRAGGSTMLLTGTYASAGEVSRPLLDALPPRVVLARDDWDCPLVDLLADEVVKDDPGEEAVLNRLLDLLLIAGLRSWFARPAAGAPRWFVAQADPVVGPALRLMQDDPAAPWTVAGLAAAVGVSRAALARRFPELVGEPPIGFLTRWRLGLAADLLLEPGATVSAVAGRVGYSSPFTFSTAFKRAYGVSPREHRAS
jgi:AraC-like DNA-binding protein